MHLGIHPGHNPLAAFFLALVSPVYKTFSLLALGLRAIKKKAYPKAFIISIDNLSFGGTGKTPLAISLGEKLQEKKIKFAIITRGYRSLYEKTGIRVTRENQVGEVGDEAVLFKKIFPNQDVWVGRNRSQSIEGAIENRCKIIILDDGFQSREIEKDLKIMLLNPEHPSYYLRNFRFLARKEDVMLHFHPSLESWTRARNGKSSRLQGYYAFEIKNIFDFQNRPRDIERKPIAGFSAVGDNRRFQEDLSRFNLVAFKSFPDHFSFGQREIQKLDEWRKSRGAEFLVCTRKDFIKLGHIPLENIPLLYLENRIKYSIDLIGLIIDHAEKKGII